LLATAIDALANPVQAILDLVCTRDVIKDDFEGKLPSGRPFRPDVRARPRLPRGRGFTCGRVFTVRQRGKNRVRADAGVRPRGHERVRADAKKYKK
jgi:hypothetical protein